MLGIAHRNKVSKFRLASYLSGVPLISLPAPTPQKQTLLLQIEGRTALLRRKALNDLVPTIEEHELPDRQLQLSEQ